MQARSLRLGAVQMVSANGEVEANLGRAEQGAAAAADQGAQLIVLPELFSTGFEINARAWRSAEPQGGPTERWLADFARRRHCFVGGSYMERRGADYFNTFALAGPEGVAGRVRKRHPCSVEAYVFKAGDDLHVIETPLGRIGVAICYDSSLREVWDRLLAARPDLLLLPMCVPAPARRLFYGQDRIDAFIATMRDGATQTARLLGLPCALANKWGPWQCDLPGRLPPLLLGPQRSEFVGCTHVADSDGEERARVIEGVGVAVATVTLDPSRKHLVLPEERDRYKPWIAPVPAEYRAFALFEALGRRWYAGHRPA